MTGHQIPHNRTVRAVDREPYGCVWKCAALILFALWAISTTAQTFSITTAPGGLTVNSIGAIRWSSFGTMNALAVGTPSAGLTALALNNGALYYTQYRLTATGLAAGHKAAVTAYVSTNFTHPAALVVESCPYTGSCTASGGYAPLSTAAGSPTTVIASPGIGNTTVTAGLAIFLPDNDGGSAYTGTDTAILSFTMKDLTSGTTVGTLTWYLNFPAQTVQNAVQLTLGTAPSGATIAPASDYSLNFGNVNALGIGPGSGLATTSVTGGMVYSTPYLLNPAFAGMTSATATIKVYVSTNFAHPALLILQDASASAGPFTAMPTTAGTARQIATAAADRSSITRYLGLFVSNVNGAAAFTGTDNATLTFTLTVP